MVNNQKRKPMKSSEDASAIESTLYRPPFFTGFPLVDEEHRVLFRHLNSLLENPTAHPGTAVFSDIFGLLGSELIQHINTEEALMKTLPMPKENLAKHHEAHLTILEDYTNLNLLLMNGLSIDRKKSIAMVYDWVVEHMFRFDAELPNYNWESP